MEYKDYKTASDRLGQSPYDIVKDIALGVVLVVMLVIINHFLPR